MFQTQTAHPLRRLTPEPAGAEWVNLQNNYRGLNQSRLIENCDRPIYNHLKRRSVVGSSSEYSVNALNNLFNTILILRSSFLL